MRIIDKLRTTVAPFTILCILYICNHMSIYIYMGLYGDFLKWGYPESASQSLDQFSIETCLGNPRF